MACSILPLEIACDSLSFCCYVSLHCRQHGEIRAAPACEFSALGCVMPIFDNHMLLELSIRTCRGVCLVRLTRSSLRRFSVRPAIAISLEQILNHTPQPQ